MRHLLIILGILAAFVVVPAQADDIGPARVIDGDTVWIGETKISLWGIDMSRRSKKGTGVAE